MNQFLALQAQGLALNNAGQSVGSLAAEKALQGVLVTSTVSPAGKALGKLLKSQVLDIGKDLAISSLSKLSDNSVQRQLNFQLQQGLSDISYPERNQTTVGESPSYDKLKLSNDEFNRQRYYENHGLKPDGTPHWTTKSAQNKHVENGVNNIFIPIVTMAGVAEGGVAAKNLIRLALRETAIGGEITVYRVFGGDAAAEGFSWTTTHPTSVSNFRNVAGLPSGGASGSTNTANFMIQGQVKVGNVMKFRKALPLDGNIGGLPELIINPKNVRITNFSVIKP